MTAREQTELMLRWWAGAGITRADRAGAGRQAGRLAPPDLGAHRSSRRVEYLGAPRPAVSCRRLHGTVACGGFRADGSFIECPAFDSPPIRELFAAGVFSLLRSRGLISLDLVDKVMCWRHSGFDADVGSPIPSLAETVTVGLYLMRPPVAASRLVPEEDPVVRYFAKGIVPGKDTLGLFEHESRTFDYLEWMARVTSHIPERGAHLVH